MKTRDIQARPEQRAGLLGVNFPCLCGKTHDIPTWSLHYGPEGMASLAAEAKKHAIGARIVVVADSRTHQAAGRKAAELLRGAGFTVLEHIVPDSDGHSPRADDHNRDLLNGQAPAADLLVAAGSGVINDLVKWVAYLRGVPYLVVPTAASMNGYASANVAATIDGLKVLFHAAPCRAVLADEKILADAPFELTTSGLGDVLAKSVSSADWKLNQLLFGDYYCQYAVDLLRDLEPVYLDNPQGIAAREPLAMQALFEALFYSSLAMTMTGTSSPASGGEHLISHTLDMIADRDGLQHDLHGRQVGVASILMAALYEEVMAIEQPQLVAMPAEIDHHFWGSLTPVVAAEYQAKGPRLQKAAQLIADPRQWQALRQSIAPDLVAAGRLKSCLQTAGGAHLIRQIRRDGRPLEVPEFARVVMVANQMRQRFTILDVAMMLGILPGRLDQLIARWLDS